MPSKKRGRQPTARLHGTDARLVIRAREALDHASSELAASQMDLALEIARVVGEAVDRHGRDVAQRTAAFNEQLADLATLVEDINTGVLCDCAAEERALLDGWADHLRAAALPSPVLSLVIPVQPLDTGSGRRRTRHVPTEVGVKGHCTARVDPDKGHASTTKSPDTPAIALAYMLPLRLG